MAVWTYIIIGFSYMIIFLISMLATGQDGDDKWQVVRNVIMCVYGNNRTLTFKPILAIGHLGMIVMLICHVPFIYFIGKEHILSSIDELMNKSLSQMVDRIKNRFKGDPRHFLVQKKFVIR